MLFSKKKHPLGDSPEKIRLWSQVRFLTQLVIFSGALNIALLTAFFYFMFKDSNPSLPLDHRPLSEEQRPIPLADIRGNKEVLHQFQVMNFDRLAAELANTQLVEDGYTHRDLALACLVAYHHFNLQHAIAGHPVQRRLLSFGEKGDPQTETIVIFPGLTDYQYRAITHYIRTERWPLTSRGLFLLLKRRDYYEDESLVQTFFHASEFTAVEMLFNRADVDMSKKETLNLILEGDWQLLSDFTEMQRISHDLSPSRWQSFLLDYISQGSKIAMNLMLKREKVFIGKKLDDERIIKILELLDEETPEARWVIFELLTSPRSDKVWKMAAEKLYDWVGEEPPAPYDHMVALERFIPDSVLKKRVQLMEESRPKAKEESPREEAKQAQYRTYVVQEGDTLWRIGKIYNVSIDALKASNHLTSDFIKPGTALKVPENSGF